MALPASAWDIQMILRHIKRSITGEIVKNVVLRLGVVNVASSILVHLGLFLTKLALST